MRVLVLVLCCTMLTIGVVSAADTSTKQANSVVKIEDLSNNTWINTISSDTTEISSQLKLVTQDTPKEEVNKIIKEALGKVQKMRDYAEKNGIIIEGFSLNLGMFPPSITIDFKFKN